MLLILVSGFCAGLPDQLISVSGSQMDQTLIPQTQEKASFKFPVGLQRQTALLNFTKNVINQPFGGRFVFYQ